MLRQFIGRLGRYLARATDGGRAVHALLDPTAVLYDTARISNNRREKGAISVGPHSHIRGELLTFGHGGAIEIGEYCYIGEQSRLWSAERIRVGNRSLISHQVTILDNETHPFSAKARHEQFRAIITSGHPKEYDLGERPVTIGEDVLIGCMCVVLPGVTVGDAAIIGAGSVVTKDVPPRTIVAGNPARVIRELRDNER